MKLFVTMQSISVFLGIENLLIFGEENADITSTQEVCHVIYIYFWIFLGKV